MLWLSTTEIGSTKTFDTTVTQYQTAGLFTEPILRLLYKDHTHSLSEQKAAHLSAPPTSPTPFTFKLITYEVLLLFFRSLLEFKCI